MPKGELDGIIAGFSHDVTCKPQDNWLAASSGQTYKSWHVGVIEWTPSRVSFYLDGIKFGEITDPAGIPTNPMRWVLQT